jgi:hypothetical protein
MQFNTDCFSIERRESHRHPHQRRRAWRDWCGKRNSTKPIARSRRNIEFPRIPQGQGGPGQMLEKMFQKHVEKGFAPRSDREALVEFLRSREDLRIVKHSRDWKVTLASS